MPYRVILGQLFLLNVTAIIGRDSIIAVPHCNDVIQCILIKAAEPHFSYIPVSQIHVKTRSLVTSKI